MLAWCSMLHSLLFVMQHDHVLKKLNVDDLTPIGSEVCGLNICFQVVVFVIPFNLIHVCNMTMF